MSPKENFNPMSALMAILNKHKGPVDPATMQQYISFVSFMSMAQIYQAFAPSPSINTAVNSNNDFSSMLNNMLGSSAAKGSDKMNNLTSLLSDKQGIASLLASIPPEKMSQITSMLGGQGAPPSPSAGASLNSLLSGAGGSPDLSSLLSSISNKGGMLPLLSMLGGGGGGGLSPLLSLFGGKGAGNPLLSMLGSGMGGPLMSMLGGGLGGGKGGASLPFLSMFGGKGKGGLGSFMSQLGKNPTLAAMAPYAPLLFLFGGSGKNIFKGKRSKRSRRSKNTALSQEQLNSLFGNNEQMKHLIPIFNSLQSSGMKNIDFSSLAPYLLPVAAQYKKQLQSKKAKKPSQTKQLKPETEHTSMTFTQYPQHPVDVTQQVQFSPVKITPQKSVSLQQQKHSTQIPIKTK